MSRSKENTSYAANLQPFVSREQAKEQCFSRESLKSRDSFMTSRDSVTTSRDESVYSCSAYEEYDDRPASSGLY